MPKNPYAARPAPNVRPSPKAGPGLNRRGGGPLDRAPMSPAGAVRRARDLAGTMLGKPAAPRVPSAPRTPPVPGFKGKGR